MLDRAIGGHNELTIPSRSAAEIDELYERKIPAWRWSKTVTHVEEQMQAAVEASAAQGQQFVKA